MPTFAYSAVDARGRRTRGRVTGSTEAAVVRDLEARGLLPVDVREAAADRRGEGPRAGRRRAVLEFTRAVAALLPAGMPLPRAMAVAAAAAPGRFRPPLERVRERVERGDELARALGGEPGLFSPLYVGVVRAGEKGGGLPSAFERLAAHLEREDELRSRLVSLSIYPVTLGVVGLASVLVLVLFVLPRFAELLTGSGAPLPRSTAAILAASEAAAANWAGLAAGILLLVALVLWARGSPVGRRAWARLLVRAPLVGGPRRQVLAARFARMTGELLRGGAPVLSALENTEACLDDPVARGATARIRTRVREGTPLNQAILEQTIYPPELVQLVALGEEAGRLAEFLVKGAELLERRTERTLERAVRLVEPVMIVGFGGVIALVALSLLQAIYGVNAGGL